MPRARSGTRRIVSTAAASGPLPTAAASAMPRGCASPWPNGMHMPIFAMGASLTAQFLSSIYRQLQESTIDEMADIGRLVRFFGSHLVDNEILRHRTASWVTGVEKYLSQHADECVTLSDVAHAIGRSVSFLSHRFRPAFGVSFKQYQLDRRMRRARELLASGLSVKATAARMGFSDAFNFSRAFKRHWGAPPRAYRTGELLPHDRPVPAHHERQSD